MFPFRHGSGVGTPIGQVGVLLPFVSGARLRAVIAYSALGLLLVLPMLLIPFDRGDPPLTFLIALWSIFFMATPLPAVLLVFLCRSRIEELERFIHAVPAERYLTYVGLPSAAVFLAAVGGYGINLMSESGPRGYVGFLMAIPLCFLVVLWFGIQGLRQLEREGTWPPTDLPPDRPVAIRRALRRLEEADDREASRTESSRVVELLVDGTLPAVEERRDRPFRRWIRERRPLTLFTVAGWCLLTSGLFLASFLPRIFAGELRFLGIAALAVILVIGLWSGTGWTLYCHARWKADQLAKEIKQRTDNLQSRRGGDGAPT